MINNSIQSGQSLQSIRDNLPSISVGDINVAGNVHGNIIVGNHNVIGDNNVICEVHDSHGVVINLHSPPVVKRRETASPPPRSPRGFIGRESELERIRQYIQDRSAVYIHAHDGIGKTSLVKLAANLVAKEVPDGVLYVEGIEEAHPLGLQDIFQHLFDGLYESTPPIKVTTSVAQGYLKTASPLVILDHQELSPQSLGSLPDMLPQAALLVTGQKPLPAEGYETLPVTPLIHDDAIRLFSEKSGFPLESTTYQEMERICRLLDDVPLAVTRTALAIRENRLILSEVAGCLEAIHPPSQDELQAAIERSFGLIYPRLDRNEREMLAFVAAAPGISVDRSWLESLAGGPETSIALENLELLYANSPRLRLPDGIRQILQSGGKDLSGHRERLLRHLLDELRTRSQDFDFVGDELGNILGLMLWTANRQRWSDVIALGKGVDPYLALHGLWDAWDAVLNQVLSAARNLKDRAVQAWALHQLGTREIGVGGLMKAVNLLLRALSIRISLGDSAGAAHTLHNLNIILPPPSDNRPEPPYQPPSGPETVPVATGAGSIFAASTWIIPGIILVTMVWAALVPPYMILHKQASSMTYHPIGQIIQYTYTVINPTIQEIPGPITVIDDDQPVACPPLETIGDKDGYLDWNETIICSQQYTITPADVERGSVTNTAFAIAQQGEVRSSEQSVTIRYDEEYLYLGINPGVNTFSKAGEEIHFTFVVQYLGSQAIKGPVSITDTLTNVTCPQMNMFGNGDEFMNRREVITCEATYTTTEDEVGNGSITGTAQARAGELRSNELTYTIFYAPPTGLTLVKSADPETYSAVGQRILYAYTVTNWTRSDLKGPVTVVDDELAVRCPPVNTIGDMDDYLDINEELVCSREYSITETDMGLPSLTNTAYAIAGEIYSPTQSFTIYRGTHLPVLVLSESADRDQFSQVGEEVVYTYNVIVGNETSVADPIEIVDGSIQVNCPAIQTVGNANDALDPEEVLICTGVRIIDKDNIVAGSVTNRAWALAKEAGVTSNIDTVTIYKIGPEYPLELSKEAAPATYKKAGDVITYTYTVTNISSESMYGDVVIRDLVEGQEGQNTIICPLSPPPQVITPTAAPPMVRNNESVGYASLNPGYSISCTSKYVITDADVTTGSVTNTAQVFLDNPVSNPSSATVYLRKLELNIKADRDTYEKVGDEIQYSYTVTGFSTAPLFGDVTIDDDIMKVTCPNVEMVGNQDRLFEQTETLTCDAKYSVTQQDIDNGFITNTAKVYAADLESDPVSYTIQGPAPQPGLFLASSVQPSGYDSVGQTITYNYVVTNSGNVSMSPVIQITGLQEKFIDCNAEGYLFAPGSSTTCTRSYIISQSDLNFGNSAVTDNAIAVGNFREKPIQSNPAPTTVSCPYPPAGWAHYIVESGVDFPTIVSWYPNNTMEELQKRNCMGLGTQVLPGQSMYLPAEPPTSTVEGYVRDGAGAPLKGVTVSLKRNGILYKTYITEGNGYFKFTDLQPGTYQIFEVKFYLKRNVEHMENFKMIHTPP